MVKSFVACSCDFVQSQRNVIIIEEREVDGARFFPACRAVIHCLRVSFWPGRGLISLYSSGPWDARIVFLGLFGTSPSPCLHLNPSS